MEPTTEISGRIVLVPTLIGNLGDIVVLKEAIESTQKATESTTRKKFDEAIAKLKAAGAK